MQTDPSQDKTGESQVALAPKADRTDTAYMVLAMVPLADRADAVGWMLVGDSIPARSAEVAVRSYAEKAEKTIVKDGSVTLVAIPVRSWRPVKVTPKVETTLVIEDL